MPFSLKRVPTGFKGNLLLSVLGFLCGRTALAVVLVSFLVGHWPFWVPALRAVSVFFWMFQTLVVSPQSQKLWRSLLLALEG